MHKYRDYPKGSLNDEDKEINPTRQLDYISRCVDVRGKEKTLENIPIVKEFPDVFPNDLPGIPLPEWLTSSSNSSRELDLF